MALGCVSSDPAPVMSGVPRDFILEPVLFLLFVNSLSDSVCSAFRLFANGIVAASGLWGGGGGRIGIGGFSGQPCPTGPLEGVTWPMGFGVIGFSIIS